MKTITHTTLLALALTSLTGCALRDPFEATVVPVGVDASKVRAAIFDKDHTYGEDAEGNPLQVHLDIDTDDEGRPTFYADYDPSGASPTAFEFSPLKSASANTGRAVFELLDPAPTEPLSLAILAWVDEDEDGRLDLDTNGVSEHARTIYLRDEEEDTNAYLWAYNYTPASGDDEEYYTATALRGDVNVIISSGNLGGWMVLLDAHTEGPRVVDETLP